jgi:iron complex outermembrane receptor protein
MPDATFSKGAIMVARFTALLLAATALVPIQSVYAAGTDTAPAEATDDGAVGNEILVTATRRSDKLQSVPLAVTAISGDNFSKLNLKGPGDLTQLSPSVQLSIVGGNGVYIRGAGINSQNSGTEQSVGMVVDGVVLGFVDDISGDLSDLDHIEVLRGPQGTQFGKNASAGLVSILTAKPVLHDFGFKGHVSYGEHQDTIGSVVANVPIGETAALRVVGSYLNRDGVYPNILRHEKEGSRDQRGVRARLLWEPDDKLQLLLNGDFRYEHAQPNFIQAYRNIGIGFVRNGVTYAPGGLGVIAAGVTPSSTNVEIAENADAYRNTKSGGTSLEANYSLGDYTLTSLSAMRIIARHYATPIGSSPQPGTYSYNDYTGHQISQEFRVTSPADKPLQFVAGLYYYNRLNHSGLLSIGDLYGQAAAVYGAGVQVAQNGGRILTTNKNESVAGFVDGTYHITEQLKLIGGVRYTHDHVEATSFTQLIAGVPTFPGTTIKPSDATAVSKNAPSYRAGLQYVYSPDLMAYGTFAHGYKGPAADTTNAIIRAILPETVNSIEFGVKSSFIQHKLFLNLTLFNEKFKNFQTTVLNTNIVPVAQVLGNAGGQRTRGVELEMTAKPIRDLTFSSAFTYLDAKYTDFKAPCYQRFAPIPQPTTTDPNAVGACYTLPGTSTSFVQAAGARLNNSSKFTYQMNLSYTHAITQTLTGDLTANYVHRSSFRTVGYDPNTLVRPYGLTNVNLGIGNPDEGWRVGVFARNLFNKFFVSAIQANGNDPGGYTSILNVEARRTIGATLDYKFGAR